MEENLGIHERKIALKNKLKKIIKRKISPACFVIRDKEGNFETIRTDYDPQEFGFAPEKFVFVSDECEKIALCVGVGVDVDDKDGVEELWFLMENADGIAYWRGNRSSDFTKEFTLLL